MLKNILFLDIYHIINELPDFHKLRQLTKEVIADGISVMAILEEGLRKVMEEVGKGARRVL